MANSTSFPVQHASQSASVRRSACSSKFALSGYGCTTVKYLGSSSGGGGVGMRFGIRAATAKHKNAEAISSRMGGMTLERSGTRFFFYPQPDGEVRVGEGGREGK